MAIKPTTKTNKTPLTKEVLKGITNHQKTATHLEEAAKHHIDAAKHQEGGNSSKASLSIIKAQAQLLLANDSHKEAVKNHALNS